MIKYLLTFFFLWLTFVIPQPILAASEFATTYDVTYEVGKDGITQVTQKVSLKNLTSQFYASNFTLSIGSTTVSDVTASDEAGPMEVNLKQEENKTAITLKLNQQVAGLSKQQSFTLRFKSKDFAQSLGKTWEVSLPKIPEGSNIDSYNLVLSVPVEFGDPTSITPDPISHSQNFERLFFNFNKAQLEKSGVSVNFGTTQIFDFILKYRLENNSLFPVVTSITLPPDTTYQEIFLKEINPKPENVTIDSDGNYLAWYKLLRQTSVDVEVSGMSKLYIKSRNKTTTSLTPTQIATWTKSDKYWEKENPVITNALSGIFNGQTPKTNKDKVTLIYRYVVNSLKYDTSRLDKENLERLGAITALANPNSAVCMEFTDLFIALSRAAGVPARELDGFAYSQNKKLRPLSLNQDLLHAWPEYWDEKKGWVMVDPTWENTSGGVDYFQKFDLNHLVLAIKGNSSQTPYVSDNVKVTLAETEVSGKPQPEVNIQTPEFIWTGFPITVEVKVLNKGNTVSPSLPLSISTTQTKVLGSTTAETGVIPPYGYSTTLFNIKSPFFWQEVKEKLEISIAGQKVGRQVVVRPFFYSPSVSYIIGGVIVAVVLIYGLVLSFHIYRKKTGASK